MAYFLAGVLRTCADQQLLRVPEPILRFVLIFGLVGTIAVFWEFAEWTSDRYFGTNCQMRDLDDTLLDQLMGLVGAAAYLLVSLRRRAEKFLRST